MQDVYTGFGDFRKGLNECSAVVTSLDGAVIEPRIAAGIGKRYMSRELKGLDPRKVVRQSPLKTWRHGRSMLLGVANYRKVERIAKRQGEAYGLEHFVDTLARAGCADVESGRKFAGDYLGKHTVEGAKEFLSYLKWIGKKLLCVTITFDVAADVARDYFDLDGVASNRVTSEGGIITGLEPDEMNRPLVREDNELEVAEKLLGEHGLELGDCFVLGYGPFHVPLVKGAKLSLASPIAKPDLIGSCDFHFPEEEGNYSGLVEELRI